MYHETGNLVLLELVGPEGEGGVLAAAAGANGGRVVECECSWLGEPRVTGSGVSGVPGQNPYQFQGRRVDPETELQLFRNRYYDPAVGEFWSLDPSGLWRHGQGNGYSSFAGDSWNRADALGLETQDIKFDIDVIANVGAWKGKFIWECGEGAESSDIDETPGWTGWSGNMAGFKISGDIGVGVFITATAQNNSRWTTKGCQKGCKKYLVRLKVVFVKHFKAFLGFNWTMGDRVLNRDCPCRKAKN